MLITAKIPLTVLPALLLRLPLFCGHFLPLVMLYISLPASPVCLRISVLLLIQILFLFFHLMLVRVVGLGHPGYYALLRLVFGNMVKNLPLTPQQVKRPDRIPCDACNKAKAKRLPFPKAPQTYVHLCNANT